MNIVFAFLLALFVAWVIIRPHQRYGSSKLFSEVPELKNDRKVQQAQMLDDLELDYATGKVDADEYKRAKAQLSRA